jgi:hypothetical protein
VIVVADEGGGGGIVNVKEEYMGGDGWAEG